MATWGSPISLRGSTGAAGLSVLSGSGAPASSLGYDGQVYVDTAAGALYARANGTWSLTKSLIGPMGINGVNGSFLAGAGAPTSAQAPSSGQAVYLQTTGEIWIYQSSAQGWQDTGENFTGPQGAQGVPGLRGTQTYTGSGAPSSTLTTFTPPAVAGDLYYDTGTAGGPYLYVLGS